VEGAPSPADAPSSSEKVAPPPRAFRAAVAQVWADPTARGFTLFVFVSMLAYSAQELILEPFAGLVFKMTPGQSTQLSGLQHGGVLLGMILFGVLGARLGARRRAGMRSWTLAGCLGSALALTGMAAASLVGPAWPLAPTVFALGFANGVFAVSAVGAMMSLAGAGQGSGAGVRMGVWGAAQACAFACGGFLGAMGVDVTRGLLHQPGPAFFLVFCAEAAVFLVAAALAGRLDATAAPAPAEPVLEPQTLLGGVHG
jgi:BCD family chlorophyll transporter-like MFS transporter